MSRVIFCSKLKREEPGFEKPPFAGDLGQKIYDSISLPAWKMWISHQTMLINEYRLSLIDPKAKEFLLKEMENYFFGPGSDKPKGFTEQK